MVTPIFSLNVRAEKRRLTTTGIFCPRTTAELGDRPGLVSARMVGPSSLYSFNLLALHFTGNVLPMNRILIWINTLFLRNFRFFVDCQFLSSQIMALPDCIYFDGFRITGILSDTEILYFEGRNTAKFQSADTHIT